MSIEVRIWLKTSPRKVFWLVFFYFFIQVEIVKCWRIRSRFADWHYLGRFLLLMYLCGMMGEFFPCGPFQLSIYEIMLVALIYSVDLCCLQMMTIFQLLSIYVDVICNRKSLSGPSNIALVSPYSRVVHAPMKIL